MSAMRRFLQQHAILTGVVLIFVCTWSIDLWLALQAQGVVPTVMPEWVGPLVGYGFVVVALLATWLVDGKAGIGVLLRRYLIWRVGWRWYAMVILGPAAVVLAAIGIARLLGNPMPDFSEPLVRQVIGQDVPLNLAWLAVIWFFFEILTNGEEIGWRGYLLPRMLARTNALLASLWLGALWALWHLPKFWQAGAGEAARGHPFWVSTVMIIAFSVLFTWVYQHTRGSLLLAVLFHAASNTAFLCLPIGVGIAHGALPFYIAIGLYCVWALGVAVITGPDLTRNREPSQPF